MTDPAAQPAFLPFARVGGSLPRLAWALRGGTTIEGMSETVK